MLNDMGEHERFRELCAFAAIGEVDEDELSEMKAHLSICVSCRIEYAEYTDILHNRMPIARHNGHDASLPITGPPREYRRRFIREAQRRGFRFSREAARPPFSFREWRQASITPVSASLAAIVLLTAAVVVLAHLVTQSHERNRELVALMSTTEVIESRTDSEFQVPVVADAPKPVTGESASEVRRSLEKDLSMARAENASLQARSRALDEQVAAMTLQIEGLRAEVESGRISGSEVASRLREAEGNLIEMAGEVRRLREGRSDDATTISAQEARLRLMSDRLRAQAEAIDLERRMLSADRDIRDLITARNLHVIDVFDIDGRGEQRKIFGRAFFTENKSLVLYAFDVEDRKIAKAGYTLQAWGEQLPTGGSVRSLGVFYIDDEKHNRWVLKFDDTEILAQIDAVFVTIEPRGGSKTPRGEKLLYAYLRKKPNHP